MRLPTDYRKLSPSERRLVREEYIRRQKGRCHYCKNSLKGEPAHKVSSMEVDKRLFPSGFFDYPVHLHHDHKTGMTIGAVHSYCNAVLWQYEGE